MRFAQEMATANRALTLAGVIVLAPAVVPGAEEGELSAGQRDALSALHLRKIDLADRVLVVNPGGYVGETTRREIGYARATGTPVCFTHST